MTIISNSDRVSIKPPCLLLRLSLRNGAIVRESGNVRIYSAVSGFIGIFKRILMEQ